MLFFLFFLGNSLERFSLQPPFEMTDINEIGNWSFVGSTVSRKYWIQLTSGVPNELGGLCYRSPSVYTKYFLMFELAIKNLPGNGLYIYFTNEVCQIKPTNFTGVAYYIDLSRSAGKKAHSVYFLDNSNGTNTKISLSDFTKVGEIEILENSCVGCDTDHIAMSVSKSPNGISLAYTNSETEGNPIIVHQYNNTIIDRSYFSMISENSQETASKTRLFSLLFFTYEKEAKEFNDTKLVDKNRKIITTKFYERKLKKQRRLSKMPTYQFYFSQMKNVGEVDGKDKKLSDAIPLVNEMKERSKQMIGYEQLDQFVQNKVIHSLEKAMTTIMNMRSDMNMTKDVISDLWNDLNSKLAGLRIETSIQMDEIRKEMELALNDLNFGKCGLESALGLETGRREQIVELLRFISIVEFIIYIILFVILHKTTNGFRNSSKKD